MSEKEYDYDIPVPGQDYFTDDKKVFERIHRSDWDRILVESFYSEDGKNYESQGLTIVPACEFFDMLDAYNEELYEEHL